MIPEKIVSAKTLREYNLCWGEIIIGSVYRPYRGEDYDQKQVSEEIVRRYNCYKQLLEACKQAREKTYHLGSRKIREILEDVLDKAIAAAATGL